MQVPSNAPQINVRVPPELKKALAHRAIDEGRSLSTTVVRILLEDQRRREEDSSQPA